MLYTPSQTETDHDSLAMKIGSSQTEIFSKISSFAGDGGPLFGRSRSTAGKAILQVWHLWKNGTTGYPK